MPFLAEETPLPTTTANGGIEKPGVCSPIEAKHEQRPRESPVSQVNQTTDLDEMRTVIGKIREEKKALRRKCSIVAFESLVRSGCEIDRILEFLGDRTLNRRGARNLKFFVAYCLETSKVEEMRILCRWMAQQLYVGRYSDSALLLVLQSLFNIRHQGEWQSVLENFCENVVQALQSSPVVHVEYLKPKTWSSFLGILFHDIYSDKLLSTGITFVNNSSPVQLDYLTERIWPLVNHWVHSPDPLQVTELSPMAEASKVTALLQALPQAKLCETVTAVSWRLLDSLHSAKDFRTLWRRQSIWWSAIDSPGIIENTTENDSWSKIAHALRRKQDEYLALSAAVAIKEYLDLGNLGAAHRTMLQCPQLSFDHCPELAEALIVESERDAKTALEMLKSRRSSLLKELENVSELSSLNQLRQDRLDLLERMASAYAKASHIKPSFAFRCVYECWNLQKQDDLGPVRPAMARALIQSGIVRPLQTGRRLVSHARLEWLLLQVAEAEGKDVMRKIGAAVWQWRDEVIRQMEDQRNAKRQGIIKQQWHQQSTMRREPDHWDALKSIALAEKRPSSNSADHRSLAAKKAPISSPFRVKSRWDTENDLAQSSTPPPPTRHVPLFPSEDDETIGKPITEQSTSMLIDSDTSTSATSVTSEPVSEKPEHVMHCVSPDEARAQNLDRQTWRSVHLSPATLRPDCDESVSPKATSQPSPRLVSASHSSHKQDHRAAPVRSLDSLLKQLNSAPPIGCEWTFASHSDHFVDALAELHPVPSCSLAAAAVHRSNAVAEGDGKGLVIRRVVGVGVVHGERGGEEPSTLSTALQPAVGSGVGVLLGGSGLEGFGP
ncbi:MAG: hypothetical protein LQ338_003560 [Usnochroma carphineum]|nr:MAG: hypothetical protein LQ338_003560 [Usnochroma carphineum]